MNIYEKLSAITSEISTVAKNLTVGEGRSSYKAVGEGDVLAAVKPIEAKYKVYSYPVNRRIVSEDIITNKSTYNGQEKETSKLFMRIETTYRFVNTEAPDEYVDITTYGDGVDSQDKACGKAMTYADKYALLKAYKIRTGDDPDQEASEPLSGMRNFEQNREELKRAEEIKESISAVVKAGTSLIKAGVNKDQISETVAMFNDGDGNPKTIKEKRVCDAILKEFEKLKPSK